MTSKQKIVLISVLVAVAVILVAVGGYFIAVYSSASGARTSGGFTYEVEGKTVTITAYTGSDTTVTVPAKIGGRRVAKIAKGAFSSSKATSIVFDADISQITLDEECFKGQTTITYVELPSALKEIPASCFEDCTALGHIVLPAGVTKIGNNAFEGCSSLSYTGNDSENKVVTLPSELTSLGEEAFKECTKISSLVVGDKLQIISKSAFEGCTSLSKITFGDESAVSRIQEKAFYNTRLNGFKLPDTLLTIDAYAFAKDTSSSFTSLTVPASVTQIDEYAFSGCTYLKTVTFAEGSAIKKIGEGIFKDCAYLTSITLPATLTEIPSLAFNGCTRHFAIVKLDDYYEFNSDKTSTTARSHYLLMNADKSEILAYIGKFDSSDCINDKDNKTSDSFDFLLSADIAKTLKKIDGYAFSGLKADKLCIPVTVGEIGKNFIASGNVKTVYFENGDCTLDEKAFDGISGELRVYSFKEGTIKEFVDDLNEKGNNDIKFYVGVDWPD